MVDFSNALHLVRERAPLVQCITNFVTVNDCANIILAAGGSPSMAHDIREVEDAVSGVRALVCNMGAIEDIDAMVLAGKRANQLGTPVVLDPVAAGGTRLRRESAKRLLEKVRFTAIRGNASEDPQSGRPGGVRQRGGCGGGRHRVSGQPTCRCPDGRGAGPAHWRRHRPVRPSGCHL